MRALPRRSNARERPTALTKKRGFAFCEFLLEIACIHPFRVSRRYAANWVRLGKSVILPRAVGLLKGAFPFCVTLSGAGREGSPCGDERV